MKNRTNHRKLMTGTITLGQSMVYLQSIWVECGCERTSADEKEEAVGRPKKDEWPKPGEKRQKKVRTSRVPNLVQKGACWDTWPITREVATRNDLH